MFIERKHIFFKCAHKHKLNISVQLKRLFSQQMQRLEVYIIVLSQIFAIKQEENSNILFSFTVYTISEVCLSRELKLKICVGLCYIKWATVAANLK